MSPNMKISLLTLVGAAAAVPHYGGHSKFHHRPSGFPSGGWGGFNSTRPGPTGTGTGVVPVGDKTTTLQETQYSTETVVKTIYATRPTGAAGEAPSSVGVADASTGGAEGCGPATVYVTATDKITVTVPAGGAGAPSSASPPSVPEASSEAPEVPEVTPSAPAAPSDAYGSGYSVTEPVPVASASESSFVLASSAAVEEKPSSAAAVSTPAPVPEEAETSAAVVPSSAAPVVESSAVATSAAPSATPSTPSGGYSGGKRGLVYRWDGAADCKSFADKNFGFAWNWESKPNGDIGGIPFFPILRTLDNTGDWSTNVESAISGGASVVFGLNEPDIASQANLGVSAACDAWKTYMNPIAEKHSDVTIVGPSVSSSQDAGKGLDWLEQFQSQCTDAKWTDANLHWYGPASAGFDAFKAHIEDARSRIGKPFWVTEFGLEPGSSPEDSATFLGKAQEYLDGLDDCKGYSYFAVGSFDAGANLLGTASSLSKTGEVYVN